MKPAGNPIDEPLGRAQRERKKSAGQRWRAVWLVLVAVVLFASSGAVALRERPFREPTHNDVAEILRGGMQEEAAQPKRAFDIAPQNLGRSPETEFGAPNAIIVRDPSSVGQHARLAHLPDRDLLEDSETGPLPVRGADGRRPFDVYARPWSGTRGAKIAIVIGGLGISQTGTQDAIAKLPPEITLAFAPLGNSLIRWMQEARRAGHELMLQVPMEPFDYPNVDPGRYTLLTQATPEQNLENLHRVLSRMTNYVGIMNYMGSRFTADRNAMTLLMKELSKRGLSFLDDGTSARSLAQEVALTQRVPLAFADLVIDHEREPGAIFAKLDELERIARARGFAVGGGSALGVTVDTVAAWAGEVRKRGIELVPVSAVTHDPESDR